MACVCDDVMMLVDCLVLGQDTVCTSTGRQTDLMCDQLVTRFSASFLVDEGDRVMVVTETDKQTKGPYPSLTVNECERLYSTNPSPDNNSSSNNNNNKYKKVLLHYSQTSQSINLILANQ